MTKRETKQFRKYLEKENVKGVKSYEWYDGEGFYYGDPIYGRAFKEEMNAIEKMWGY